DRERCRAGVEGMRGGPIVKDAAAQAAAAVAAGPAGAAIGPVAGECATRDDEAGLEQVRDPAAYPIATVAAAPLAADGLVVRDRAVADRGLAAPGRSHDAGSAYSEPTARADAHEGASRVAGAADGPVVAERQVASDQNHPATRRILRQRDDGAPQGRAHTREPGAASRVAAASQGLVVVERTVRDPG